MPKSWCCDNSISVRQYLVLQDLVLQDNCSTLLAGLTLMSLFSSLVVRVLFSLFKKRCFVTCTKHDHSDVKRSFIDNRYSWLGIIIWTKKIFLISNNKLIANSNTLINKYHSVWIDRFVWKHGFSNSSHNDKSQTSFITDHENQASCHDCIRAVFH